MDKIGILLYGYNKSDAAAINNLLSKELKKDILLLSASGMEDRPLKEALEIRNKDHFEEKETAILVFLGFDNNEIQKALHIFPQKKIRRPIFCGLTEKNIRWPVKKLIAHLMEEELYWKKKNS